MNRWMLKGVWCRKPIIRYHLTNPISWSPKDLIHSRSKCNCVPLAPPNRSSLDYESRSKNVNNVKWSCAQIDRKMYKMNWFELGIQSMIRTNKTIRPTNERVEKFALKKWWWSVCVWSKMRTQTDGRWRGEERKRKREAKRTTNDNKKRR